MAEPINPTNSPPGNVAPSPPANLAPSDALKSTPPPSESALKNTPPATPPADLVTIKEPGDVMPPVKAARPEWLPETLFDAEKGVKVDDVKALLGEAAAAREAKAKLPATPDAYQPTIAKFEGLPDGAAVDVNNPIYKNLTELAHKHGLPQEAVSQLLALDAQRVIAQQKQITDAIKARDTALGPNAAARIDALHGQIDAAFEGKKGADLKRMLVTTDAIEGFEAIFKELGSQGVDGLKRSTSPGGGDAGKIPGYKNMTFSQKLAAGGHI